jgi:metal-responsive CopG/Arc/MetJ family transcriptional regulator
MAFMGLQLKEKPMAKHVTISVSMDPEVVAAFDKACAKTGATRSKVLALMMQDYVAKTAALT